MTGTSLDDVLLVNPSRVRPAPAGAVAEAESALGRPLPAGYAAYVERLGDGSLGHLVRVTGPAALEDASREWRERSAAYWFWDMGDTGVTPESLQAHGVLLADTYDGDELVLDPSGAMVVLPRNEDAAVRVGPDFIDALDWLLSGRLNPWVEGWTFEAHEARVNRSWALPAGLTLASASDAVATLGAHDHVVEVDGRRTFFLPSVEGRLSLYQPEDEDAMADLSHDEGADPAEVARVTSALGAP